MVLCCFGGLDRRHRLEAGIGDRHLKLRRLGFVGAFAVSGRRFAFGWFALTAGPVAGAAWRTAAGLRYGFQRGGFCHERLCFVGQCRGVRGVQPDFLGGGLNLGGGLLQRQRPSLGVLRTVNHRLGQFQNLAGYAGSNIGNHFHGADGRLRPGVRTRWPPARW